MTDELGPPLVAPGGDGGEPTAAPGGRRRSRGRRVLIVLASLLAVLGVGALGGYFALQGLLGRELETLEDPFEALPTRAPTVEPTEDGYAPVNVLLLGSDSRISAGDPTQWAYGAQRTDAIMLLHIPGDRSGAFVMSIPRDSWVDVPGHGQAKINAAFSWGGPTLLIQTVEQLTGVHIDHFAVADFESFAALTDAVGGVEITVAEDSYAYGELQFAAGTYHMNGEEALRYARQRYGLPGGDFDRIQRQQNWMRAIARSAIDNGVLTSPAALLEFLLTATRSVAVDEGFTLNVMRGIAMTMVDVRPENVMFLTVPEGGTGWSPDGRQSIVVVDRARLDPLMLAVAEDRLAEYLAEHAGDVRVLGSAVN